jgi:hypothetical protein
VDISIRTPTLAYKEVKFKPSEGYLSARVRG